MSEINITTVRDMIDSSFNGEDTNTVNFTMIQNVLYILAKQLKILQRHVSLEYSKRLNFKETEIKITEIKVHSRESKSPESKASQGTKEGPGHHGGKGGPEGKEGQGGQAGKGGLGGKVGQEGQRGQDGIGSKGGQGGQGGKGGQGAHGGPEDKEGRGGENKARQATAESKESRDVTRRPGSPESVKKQRQGDKDIEEEGRQAKDAKVSDKSSKGKATDTAAADDALTSKAADRKSPGKGGDRKGGKKGDDDDDVVHEKLLVVSRTSSSSDSARGTVATLDQFRNMVTQIRELQAIYGLEDSLDDEKLRSALHRQTSLSHPIAAVNMSARLEAAEKRLAAIIPIVTDLARKTSGIDLESAYDDIFLKPPSASKTREEEPQSGEALKLGDTKKGPAVGPKQESEAELEMEAATNNENAAPLDPNFKGVTRDEMNDGLEEIYLDVMKNVTGASKTNYTAADGAMKRTQRVDARLDQAMKLGDIFTKLDTSVEDYTDRINDLDGRLTTQMTNYQDELMQMQHSLESGLDTMAEVLAAPTEDAAAIAELNGYFTCFQLDIERTLERQDDLRKLQKEYSENLDELKQKIKDLQIRKCTRDELADALSDKAGIAALNGLVTMEQYQAVRGDFEKRIGFAYDKFNTKEITWQKAIDDLVRELNEKTDFTQLAYLNKGILKYLAKMRGCLDEMLHLVGEIDPITTNRKIERTDKCLSCGSQFNAGMDEDHLGSRHPVIGAESAAAKEDPMEKYHRKCYPGYSITHPIDPRSLTCHRYCGAADPSARESAFKMHVSKMNPNHGTTVGTDGKDDFKRPCLPCNKPKQSRISGSPPDSIRLNRLVSDTVEKIFEGASANEEKGIIE